MIFELLRRLGGGGGTRPGDRSAELRAGAGRFRDMLQSYSTYKGPDSVAPAEDAIDRAFAERLPANASEGATLSFLSDAASYLGERLRGSWAGGTWEEDDTWGLHLKGIAGIDHARYFPLALAEKKRALGERLSVAGFLATLDRRLAAEKEKAAGPLPLSEGWRGLQDTAAGEWALARSEEFRQFWQRRFGTSLPVNLVGVREVDGFLRSHYIVNFISDADLVRAGFYLGEVGRGLFGGEWVLHEADTIEKAAVRYPELDYFPLGRVFKMMTERPEGSPLDEYIRLIPSARKELAGGHPHGKA